MVTDTVVQLEIENSSLISIEKVIYPSKYTNFKLIPNHIKIYLYKSTISV